MSRESSNLIRALRVPIQSFIHTEEIGAIILLLSTGAALGLANSPWSDRYVDFWHTTISVDINIFALSETLEHLVNDGLMAVFFLCSWARDKAGICSTGNCRHSGRRRFL